MNGATVTQCATICTPEKLTREELIAQVHYLQESALKDFMAMSEVRSRLQKVTGVARRQDAMLCALADSFDAGDQAAILLQVKNLSEQRAARKTKVH
jgi:hypothetical protein